LSLSFLIHAAHIETGLGTSIFAGQTIEWLVSIFRICGYVFVIGSLLADPVQHRPKIGALAPMMLVSQGLVFFLLQPFLAAVLVFLYVWRAVAGLEKHLLPLVLGFLGLTLAEFFGSASFLRQTESIGLYQLVAPFGAIWIVEHALIFISAAIVGRWVLGYLLKRFQTQLFMIYTASILVIYIITTVSFTGLLLKNLQQETLRQLKTDVKVIEYAIESKKSETLSDAQVFAQNPAIAQAILDKAAAALSAESEKYLLTKREHTLLILNENGQVIARGENKEQIGDSLSEDPLVKRVLLGKSVSAMAVRSGVLAPELSVRAAVPIVNQEKIIGAILAGTFIDSAFVDGIKTATDLDTAIFAGTQVSATTLTQNNRRLVGVFETNKAVKSTVLDSGEAYASETQFVDKYSVAKNRFGETDVTLFT